MADQTFQVNAGFFDSVNQDRLYYANDMNKPYKRIVANGVFATPQGTPSTDLQVIANGTMTVTVAAGEGLFAARWFENPRAISISVPGNNNAVPRLDSVIVQIDGRPTGRVGNVVYRTGTPAETPAAPAINQTAGVVEYRVANIRVAPNANSITNSSITDLRGSESCPWVTSLIQQVDTSTLYTQWQTAYQNYYDQSTQQFEQAEAEREEAWQEFFDGLTQDLQITTNVIKLTSSYTTTATTTNIPVGILSYNPATDILMVYINGLLADSSKYTYVSSGNKITLTNALSSGQAIYFVVFKSVITGDISTIQGLIQNLENEIAEINYDSDWITVDLESGITAFNGSTTPAVRISGNRVYLRGAIKGATTIGATVGMMPVDCRPAINHYFTTTAISGTSVQSTIVIQILPTGEIQLLASSGAIQSATMIPIDTNFILD